MKSREKAKSPSPTGKAAAPRARGRPRSEQARLAILKAARDLLERGGIGAVTVEGVAERAGVGKPTIYRYWPNGHAVAMAALLETSPAPEPVQRARRSALLALKDQLQRIVTVFGSPVGRHVATMIAASEGETELSKAFRNHFLLARREEGRALLLTAIKQGELRRDIDLDVALDLIYAPIFYRLLMGHAKLDSAFTDAVIRQLLRGLAAGSAAR
jgi:AcrR family transcriptional regulator